MQVQRVRGTAARGADARDRLAAQSFTPPPHTNTAHLEHRLWQQVQRHVRRINQLLLLLLLLRSIGAGRRGAGNGSHVRHDAKCGAARRSARFALPPLLLLKALHAQSERYVFPLIASNVTCTQLGSAVRAVRGCIGLERAEQDRQNFVIRATVPIDWNSML